MNATQLVTHLLEADDDVDGLIDRHEDDLWTWDYWYRKIQNAGMDVHHDEENEPIIYITNPATSNWLTMRTDEEPDEVTLDRIVCGDFEQVFQEQVGQHIE
jgi:hypothetical protein